MAYILDIFLHRLLDPPIFAKLFIILDLVSCAKMYYEINGMILNQLQGNFASK